MSEEMKQNCEKIAEIVNNLPETKRERLLGIAEGLAITAEQQAEQENAPAE